MKFKIGDYVLVNSTADSKSDGQERKVLKTDELRPFCAVITGGRNCQET